MPGMLTDQQQPSSGPPVPTPPVTSPGAGNPPRDKAPGPEQPAQAAPQDVQALKDRATELVYGERFDQLIKMFQTNGPEKFARSMAIAVNTALSEIEKQAGTIGPEAAAEIGGDLFLKLLEDMLTRPKDGMAAVVEGVTGEELQEVIPAILVMYADSHPDVSKEDVQAVMMEVDKGVKSAGGAPQSGPAEATTPAGTSAPEGSEQASPPPGMLSQPGGPQ